MKKRKHRLPAKYHPAVLERSRQYKKARRREGPERPHKIWLRKRVEQLDKTVDAWDDEQLLRAVNKLVKAGKIPMLPKTLMGIKVIHEDIEYNREFEEKQKLIQEGDYDDPEEWFESKFEVIEGNDT